MINNTVKTFVVISLVVGPFMFYNNLDPFYFSGSYIIHEILQLDLEAIAFSGFKVKSVFNATRCILTILMCAEASRSHCFNITMLLYWLEMQTKYLHILTKLPVEKALIWYPRFQIVLATMSKPLFRWLQVLLETFFWVIVSCNVATIKLSSVIPIATFMLIPVISLTDMMIIYLVFPLIAECPDHTAKLLKSLMLELNLGKTKRRMLRKKLKSMKIITLYCGKAFPLKNETKTTFYHTIIQRTLDGILLN